MIESVPQDRRAELVGVLGWTLAVLPFVLVGAAYAAGALALPVFVAAAIVGVDLPFITAFVGVIALAVLMGLVDGLAGLRDYLR